MTPRCLQQGSSLIYKIPYCALQMPTRLQTKNSPSKDFEFSVCSRQSENCNTGIKLLELKQSWKL